jgi:hypothetical protein
MVVDCNKGKSLHQDCIVWPQLSSARLKVPRKVEEADATAWFMPLMNTQPVASEFSSVWGYQMLAMEQQWKSLNWKRQYCWRKNMNEGHNIHTIHTMNYCTSTSHRWDVCVFWVHGQHFLAENKANFLLIIVNKSCQNGWKVNKEQTKICSQNWYLQCVEFREINKVKT